jgi:hypothetical protein
VAKTSVVFSYDSIYWQRDSNACPDRQAEYRWRHSSPMSRTLQVAAMIVLKILEDAFGGKDCAGYIQSYDTSVCDEKGYGKLSVTDDIAEAKKFTDFIEASNFWKQQSETVPIRPDGRPNRPLTAFTVTLERIGYA